MGIENKLEDWKERLRDRKMLSVIVVLFSIIVILGVYAYIKQREFRIASENSYNLAFFELVDYVQNVENYLGKSLISTTPKHGAETLTRVWREANLAQAYLAQLPIGSHELENTTKFLNQVSEYSYSLSKKNIYNESLKQEDLDNLKQLHDYSIELENTLTQLSDDINNGRIKWGELTKKGTTVFATQVSNISKDSFSNLEENFHEYAGLIYDGAFSEHITKAEKVGLTGEDISEEDAKNKVKEFVGEGNIEEIIMNGLSENTDMPTYDFDIKLRNKNNGENNMVVSISKKGGHIVFSNYNRNVEAETMDYEKANEYGINYLTEKGFQNMKETYYLKQDGILTINYAYQQDGVVMYPDLIKVKVALDNGEILGIETTGYLNSHMVRDLTTHKISKEEAKKTLNKNLNIIYEGLAIIPTEYKTEVLCWEFKGTIDGTEFLVYINAENGREEDILTIVNTPDGILTM